MRNIFKEEGHYFLVASIFMCAYVAFMHFIFNEEWANSRAALETVAIVGKIIPAVRAVTENSVDRANYWGLFFALFWITSPIYWLLGFLGAFRLSSYRYEKLVIETSFFRIVLILITISLCVAFLIVFPISSGMFVVRQTSNFFPVLALSWWVASSSIYYQAQSFRVFVIKFAKK